MKIRYCAVALVALISAASAQPDQDPLRRFRRGSTSYDWRGLVESRAIHGVKGAQFQPDQLRAFLPNAWQGWDRLSARNVEQAEELRGQLLRLERELRAIEAPRDALAYYRTPGGFDWATLNAQNVLFRPSAMPCGWVTSQSCSGTPRASASGSCSGREPISSARSCG